MRGDELHLSLLHPADIPHLTRLMREAFDADVPADASVSPELLDCYHNDDLFHKWPPGCLDAERYSVAIAGVLAGAAVIWHYPAATAVLGLLFVAPAHQQRGIGTRIWRDLEARYDEAARWLVSAPAWSGKTQRFYRQACGFQFTRQTGAYVVLEKVMRR